MFALLRALTSTGLDRSLARTEAFTLGTLRSLYLTVRHLRAGQPSYWFLDAVFHEPWNKGVGDPMLPVQRKQTFQEDEEVQTVWDWVLDTTRSRGLHTARLDEQLWCGPVIGGDFDANLQDARKCLHGEPQGLRLTLWADDRSSDTGFTLSAEFPGRAGADRPAKALLCTGPDSEMENAEAWMKSTGIVIISR